MGFGGGTFPPLRGGTSPYPCNAEGTLFCPSDTVTRAQMAAFIHRALG